MTTAIEKALALAQRIPPAEIEQSAKESASIAKQIKRGTRLLDNLLGIEKPAEESIKNSLTGLRKQQSQLQSRIMLGARYHILSMEPLKWRDKDGWPKLVVFSLDSPTFELVSKGREAGFRDYEIRHEKRINAARTRVILSRRKIKNYVFTQSLSPALPSVLAACYTDVLDKIGLLARGRQKSLTLRCQFKGMIPLKVKQGITAAREFFKGNSLFLVAEPNGFTISERSIPVPRPRPNPDPLIVGFDGHQLWLVADFDTTPVEEAMIFSEPQ